MSNAGSNKKEPPKKASNSYSLLLKGLNEVEKTKPKVSTSSKKSKDNLSQSIESPERNMSSRNDYSDNPSTSNDNMRDIQTHPDVPDRSFGDYYCKLCDSHMNSDAMWEAHITGKRHIKNVTKGDTESKYEDLPDVESSIKHEIKDVKDPVVGLSYIHEIRRREPNVPPIYNCFLCHASIATVPLVIEHVISMKHRLNYIKENNPEEYQLMEATNLKKGHMEPLVIEAAREMEQKVGRGTVKVKIEKRKDPAPTWVPHKKPFNPNLDYHDKYNQKPYPKNANYEELGPRPDVWKSIQPMGRSFEREDPFRRDIREVYMSRSRSRSPRDIRERKRMYSGDDDNSRDSYKRSFSNRDRSPSLPRDNYEKRSYSKRDVSPDNDLRSSRHKTDDYLQSTRRIDSRDKLSYIPSRYEIENPRESPGISYPPLSQNFQRTAYLRSVDEPAPATAAPSQPKSFEDVFEYASSLSTEECYRLCYLLLRSLPDVSKVSEMMNLLKLTSEAQKRFKRKVNEEVLSAILSYQKAESASATNAIPGLDVFSSAANLHSRTDNSPETSNTEKILDYLRNISSKTPTAPCSMPASYAPTINSQAPPALGNTTYQAPPANFQASPSNNTYQGASMNSFPNQAPYRFPNANMPYGPGSVPNIRGHSYTDNANNPQSQVFNYSRFPSTSTSSALRNFPPRKY